MQFPQILGERDALFSRKHGPGCLVLMFEIPHKTIDAVERRIVFRGGWYGVTFDLRVRIRKDNAIRPGNGPGARRRALGKSFSKSV